MPWNHDAARERILAVGPGTQGVVRGGREEGAGRLWAEHAARLRLNRDFRINSRNSAACLIRKKSLGGRAWPGFRLHDPAHEAPVLLWATTTLGPMAFWWLGTRQQLGRGIIGVSSLPGLPVLDARKLSGAQTKEFAKLFGRSAGQELRPADEASRDPVRIAPDKAVPADVLGLLRGLLGPLSALREQWCGEPTAHGGKRPGTGGS